MRTDEVLAKEEAAARCRTTAAATHRSLLVLVWNVKDGERLAEAPHGENISGVAPVLRVVM